MPRRSALWLWPARELWVTKRPCSRSLKTRVLAWACPGFTRRVAGAGSRLLRIALQPTLDLARGPHRSPAAARNTWLFRLRSSAPRGEIFMATDIIHKEV